MLGSIILAFVWAGVKFLIGAALCMVSFSNHFIGFLVCTSGAFSGVVVFTYGGLWIEEKFKHRFLTKGKHFNKRTRLLVRMKRNGGLPLVAFLTPVFLSIPIGCIMATTLVHSRRKIIFYMFISVVFWAVVIFGTAALFNLNLAKALSDWWAGTWEWIKNSLGF
jgi:hypothetical protein